VVEASHRARVSTRHCGPRSNPSRRTTRSRSRRTGSAASTDELGCTGSPRGGSDHGDPYGAGSEANGIGLIGGTSLLSGFAAARDRRPDSSGHAKALNRPGVVPTVAPRSLPGACGTARRPSASPLPACPRTGGHLYCPVPPTAPPAPRSTEHHLIGVTDRIRCRLRVMPARRIRPVGVQVNGELYQQALGEELRLLRNRRGWTRKQLNQHLQSDISLQTLATYELGTR